MCLSSLCLKVNLFKVGHIFLSLQGHHDFLWSVPVGLCLCIYKCKKGSFHDTQLNLYLKGVYWRRLSVKTVMYGRCGQHMLLFSTIARFCFMGPSPSDLVNYCVAINLVICFCRVLGYLNICLIMLLVLSPLKGSLTS